MIVSTNLASRLVPVPKSAEANDPGCESSSLDPPVPSPALSRKESWRTVGVALVDEFPLRRTSTLALLRAHIRAGARPFHSVSELLAYWSTTNRPPRAIIMAVGSRSVTCASIKGQLQQLSSALSAAPIIVLSDLEQMEEVSGAFRLGVRGYITSNMAPNLVIEAIRIVLSGGTFISIESVMQSHPKSKPHPMQDPPIEQRRTRQHEQWPARQLAVLDLLLQGRANKEIGHLLGMEESTVKVHVRLIMRKLAATNRTQAALSAHRLGILSALDASQPSAA